MPIYNTWQKTSTELYDITKKIVQALVMSQINTVIYKVALKEWYCPLRSVGTPHCNSVIFKGYLLPHLKWGPTNDHGFLN